MLAVAPDAQRRGVGRRLVQACIDRARAAKNARIVLHTNEAMAPAQALYRSLGFDRRPDRDLHADSTRLIAYVLELRS
jgi:ribosomal protein S18 acetylase RimI-like enzyme